MFSILNTRVYKVMRSKFSGVNLVNNLNEIIERALQARRSVMGEDAFRVFNSGADGIAGLVIEKFGKVLFVQLHEERLTLAEPQVKELVKYLHAELGTQAVYLKKFVRDRGHVSKEVESLHHEAQPWMGEAVQEEITITENGLQFLIRPYDGFSVGLFLEHRDDRRRIGELAKGKRVLNGFCYTCGFSVAAAVGGAVSVDSVDMSKRYLEWGKKNFLANGINLASAGMDRPAYSFFCSDIFGFYKRAQRQGRRYDLIVLDPPTFSRSRRPKRVFELKEQLGNLVAGAVELLEPEGLIFLATNCREISREQLEEALTSATQDRKCEIVEHPQLPMDFANDPEYSKAAIGRCG